LKREFDVAGVDPGFTMIEQSLPMARVEKWLGHAVLEEDLRKWQ
jgi:hypothetical protein